MAAGVILAKCHKHNRTFGIRVEKRENDWVSTWAFPIDEAKAKREGFDRNKIKGSLQATPDYPGCPYCGGRDLVQCGGCGKMSCCDADGGQGESGASRISREPTRDELSDSLSFPIREGRLGGREKKPENKYEGISLRCHWCGMTISDIETVESFSVKSGGY